MTLPSPSSGSHHDHGPPEFDLLVDMFTEAPPAATRSGILGAMRARPRLRPTPLSPVEALAAVADDVGELLASLDETDWATPDALGDLSVRDTVSHLTGADRYLGVTTGAWSDAPAADELDHLGVSRPSIEAGLLLSNAELLDRWRTTSAALVAHLRTIPSDQLGRPSRYNVIEASLGGVLLARAFELWTHGEDICRATGRPRRPPVAGALGAMTDGAAELVPIGYMLEFGSSDDRTVRLVLTGLGGGTWDRRLGSSGVAGDPDLVIVAEAVDFCRLIAGRLDPADLECDVIGDQALGYSILAGATRFAMD